MQDMPKNKPFLVRFTREEKRRLKKWAREEKVSMAEAVRILVHNYCTDPEED
jgi:hypothetical protein